MQENFVINLLLHPGLLLRWGGSLHRVGDEYPVIIFVYWMTQRNCRQLTKCRIHNTIESWNHGIIEDPELHRGSSNTKLHKDHQTPAAGPAQDYLTSKVHSKPLMFYNFMVTPEFMQQSALRWKYVAHTQAKTVIQDILLTRIFASTTQILYKIQIIPYFI